MGQAQHFDAIVIGDGQSGGPLSTALVAAGRKTVVIEREHAGGTCVNEGCTPTKTMVASARAAYIARRGADYGVETGQVSVNMHTVRRRKRDIVDKFRDSSYNAVVNGGVEFWKGEGRFIGPKSVEVRMNDGSVVQITGDAIFINTGTHPFVPPIDGMDRVPYLTSTSIMELDQVPDHLLVLGGGYVGLEFAQMFRRFGSRVTVVEQGPQLLGREDHDIAEAMAAILREDGLDVLLNTSAQKLEPVDGGDIRMHLRTSEGEQTVEGSHLLVAIGRKPNTGELDLDAAGVQITDRGFIKVNERLETTAPGVYAMGEVAGSPAFTHISYDDFRIVRDNLLHGGHRRTSDRLVPYVVFTDPQLGRIGLSESEAREQGRPVKVAKMPMSHVARALEVDETRGMAKVIVDAETDQIVGAAVLGLEGGEVMAMLEIAMIGKVPAATLQGGIFAHPTLAEMLNGLMKSWVEE